MQSELNWEDERSSADEEEALAMNTQKLREGSREMARQNAALTELLTKRRAMVEELRERIAVMDAENTRISREVAQILGTP